MMADTDPFRPLMLTLRALVCYCVVLLVLSAAGAGAQDVAPATSAEAIEVTIGPETLSYEEFRLKQLHFLAGRSRTGLISTSVVTAAGIALVAPALISECVRVASSSSFDDLRCSTTGKVLLGIGVPILAAGITGLIVTAVMYGVRRGKIRGIEEQLAYERHRAVRWDPARSAFAF